MGDHKGHPLRRCTGAPVLRGCRAARVTRTQKAVRDACTDARGGFGALAPAVAAAGLGSIDKRKVHITSTIKSTGEHEATFVCTTM